MPEFDTQTMLISMEQRLNERFDKIDESIEKIDSRTIETDKEAIALDGRVKSLEEKATWIKGGITAALIGVIGAISPHLKAILLGK